MNTAILSVEWLITVLFMALVWLTSWKDATWQERIAFLIVPLIAVLASFMDDWIVNAVLLIGTVALIMGYIKTQEMSDMLNEYMPELCTVVGVGLLCVLKFSDISNGSFEFILLLIAGASVSAYGIYTSGIKWLKWLNARKSNVTAVSVAPVEIVTPSVPAAVVEPPLVPAPAAATLRADVGEPAPAATPAAPAMAAST